MTTVTPNPGALTQRQRAVLHTLEQRPLAPHHIARQLGEPRPDRIRERLLELKRLELVEDFPAVRVPTICAGAQRSNGHGLRARDLIWWKLTVRGWALVYAGEQAYFEQLA